VSGLLLQYKDRFYLVYLKVLNGCSEIVVYLVHQNLQEAHYNVRRFKPLKKVIEACRREKLFLPSLLKYLSLLSLLQNCLNQGQHRKLVLKSLGFLDLRAYLLLLLKISVCFKEQAQAHLGSLLLRLVG
jgi:hypothetical protein